MAPNWNIGRTGQFYGAEESAYGTAPSFAATDAIRHLNAKLSFNPRNLAKSPERHTTPGQRVLYTRRQSADFDLKAMLYPSATLNTLPEATALLKNALGATPSNITLSTTFSGTPTTTTGTIGSATGLVAGQPVQIGISGVLYTRWLTTAGTSAVWAPALPSAPAAGDTLKGCIGYAPATALQKSLDLALYPQAPSASTPARELLGCVINKLSLMFDSNLEPMIQVSGPAQGFAGTSPNFTPQSQPGGFTTVGAESAIPSGLTGYFQYGSTLYEIEKLQIDVDNAMDLNNTALGTTKANAFFRKGKRMVTGKVSAKVSDSTTLWTPSLGSSSSTMMLQIGGTSGRIWGVYMPAVTILTNPDTPDNDETNDWDFQFQALETSGNDELFIAMA